MHRTVDITVPPAATDALVRGLTANADVIGLSVSRGASVKPAGDESGAAPAQTGPGGSGAAPGTALSDRERQRRAELLSQRRVHFAFDSSTIDDEARAIEAARRVDLGNLDREALSAHDVGEASQPGLERGRVLFAQAVAHGTWREVARLRQARRPVPPTRRLTHCRTAART